MSDTQPYNKDFGASDIMGPLLRKFVEEQLIEDLTHYKVQNRDLYFDWTNSCQEGHCTDYLDGILENFSYVAVFDKNHLLIAEGWLDFVDNFFDTNVDKKVIVYWEFVTTFDGQIRMVDKTEPGIPDHIWKTLDQRFKEVYKSNRQKKKTIGLP